MNSERRRGRDRRHGVTLGQARGWLALVGLAVAGGGGAQLGRQHAEAALSQDSAKMLIHTRDREVDALRDTINHRFDGIERRLDRVEDRLTAR